MSNIAVLKFGGSSVKNIGRIEHVANIICSYRPNPVVVVVSAMGDTTDYLLSLARQCDANPDQRELDLLLSTGEQVAIVLLTLILKKKGLKAKSLTGQQAGISTSPEHGSAQILDIDTDLLRRELSENDVVVVAGFQGISATGQITTLGRGGSDTTAVALAAALGVDTCEIYTDVNGVFTADPNVIKDAVPLTEIAYAECVQLAKNGAQVIHPRAVELGEQYNVSVRVRNTFNPAHQGTEIKGVIDVEKRKNYAGVAVDANHGCISIEGIKQERNCATEIISCISQYCSSVDLISQSTDKNSDSKSLQISFQYSHIDDALKVITDLKEKFPEIACHADLELSKVTLVGSGIQGSADAACKIVSVLEKNKIEVRSVRSSDIFISCLLAKASANEAAKLIHKEFGLASAFTTRSETENNELCRIA